MRPWRATGLHRDTVIRHIKRLDVLGWVIKRASWAHEGNQSSNWYEFPAWILDDRLEALIMTSATFGDFK
jgi:hypothetical protein